jgi:hypothetical protein
MRPDRGPPSEEAHEERDDPAQQDRQAGRGVLAEEDVEAPRPLVGRRPARHPSPPLPDVETGPADELERQDGQRLEERRVLGVHAVIAVANDGETARDVGHLVDHGGERPRAVKAEGEPDDRERRAQAALGVPGRGVAGCRSLCLGQAGPVYASYSIAVLLTNASIVPSRDHDGTLIVPCPP